MTDIIIINDSIFFDRKNKIIFEELTNIQKKYKEIFFKYPCFSAIQVNSFIPINKSTEQQYNRISRNNYNNKKHFNKDDDKINPRINKKPKELEKIILGILNILNEKNYNKMLTKIRLIKSDNNIGIIIKEILQLCSMQILYVNIYMKLLNDIINLCTEIEKKITFENINLYINNYIISTEWLTDYTINPKDFYDLYCINEKKKTLLISKNIMIYNLVKLFNLDKNIKYYSNLIVNDLKLNLDNKNEEISIFIFQMLIFITKKEKQIIKDIGILDHKYLSKILHDKLSNKLKFTIEEFLILIK